MMTMDVNVALSFGLDSFEQLGMCSFKLVRKLHVRVQSVGVNLKAFSQFLGRTPKLCGFLFLFRAVNFSAFDAFAQLLLERSQNLIAPSCILPVLLIAVQPEGSVDADEHKEQFGRPATNT